MYVVQTEYLLTRFLIVFLSVAKVLWGDGFKLHLVINDMGEILSVCLTSGNVDDRNWKVISRLKKELYRKLFANTRLLEN